MVLTPVPVSRPSVGGIKLVGVSQAKPMGGFSPIFKTSGPLCDLELIRSKTITSGQRFSLVDLPGI